MVRMMASRSSPWTRSRFLTKNGSLAAWADACAGHEGVEVVVGGALAAQRLLDAVGVLDAHGDHAEGHGRAGCGRGRRPARRRAATSSVTESSWPTRPGRNGTSDVGQAVRAGDAGERGQGPVVEVGLGVGEGDEALVLGPVMPGQRAGARGRRELEAHDVEDRLHVAGPGDRARAASASSSSSVSAEDAKKLVGGSCRGSPATIAWPARDQRADGVGRGDLGRLVEDHDVEHGCPAAAAGRRPAGTWPSRAAARPGRAGPAGTAAGSAGGPRLSRA